VRPAPVLKMRRVLVKNGGGLRTLIVVSLSKLSEIHLTITDSGQTATAPQ